MTATANARPAASDTEQATVPGPAVLHMLRSYQMGGITGAVLRNVEVLRRRGAHGLRHVVCGIRPDPLGADRFRSIGVEPHSLDLRGTAGAPGAVRRLVRFIDEHDVRLVHVNQTVDLLLAGAAAALRGIPVVATVHWMIEPPSPTLSRAGRLAKRARDRVRLAAERTLTRRLIAVSAAVRQSYLDVAHRPDLAARMAVIYPGIRIADVPVPAADPALRRSLDAEGRYPLLVAACRLEEVKGARHLAPMMASVCDRWPRALLLVAGDGAQRPLVEQQVADLGLGDHVRLLGWRPDVDALLALADMVVLTSETEAAPLAIAEAMRAARPVIATDVGGVSELVRPGTTGLLVPPRDPAALAEAIDALAADRDRTSAMGLAARRLVEERFDIVASVQALETLYAELLRCEELASSA